jgi:glucose-1-phosphate thymidylyltransferase
MAKMITQKKRKGILLAGGVGTRLFPTTRIISKHFLPVYDKPMIFYPLTVLMLAGVKEILLIANKRDLSGFKALLGDGQQWGIEISYIVQDKPEGIAQAYSLAEPFLQGHPSVLILGDNIFYGHALQDTLEKIIGLNSPASVIGYHVSDPRPYGVAQFDENDRIKKIIEKPEVPPSNYAITGLYLLDETASHRASNLQKSERGELEITSLLQSYLDEDSLSFEGLGRGYAWFDMGTFDALLEASNFVRTLSLRQGLKLGDPTEVSKHLGLI